MNSIIEFTNGIQLASLNKTTKSIMESEGSKNRLLLSGKIIESYEKEGKQFIKINLDTCFIDIETKKFSETHLGDKVTIDTQIKLDISDTRIKSWNKLFETE